MPAMPRPRVAILSRMTTDLAELDALTGDYTVSGRTAAGQEYRGTLRMTRHGALLHAEEGLESLGVRFGLAMPFGGRVVMAFGAKDQVEIGAYRINGREVMGMWVPPGASDADLARCGREESLAEADGVWKIQRAQAVDGSAYAGTVTLTPPAGMSFRQRPTPVKMTWSLHDGEYFSFGLAYDDAVYSTFNLAKGQPHGLAVYEPGSDGLAGEWVGRVLEGSESAVGSETLRNA